MRSISMSMIDTMFTHSRSKYFRIICMIRRNVVEFVSFSKLLAWRRRGNIMVYHMSISWFSPSPNTVSPKINSIWYKDIVINSVIPNKSSSITETKPSLVDLAPKWFRKSSFFSMISYNIYDILNKISLIGTCNW